MQLVHLAVTFPWPRDDSPPHLAATTPLLQGVVNETALLCPNLRSLRCQDIKVDISKLRELKHLEALSLAVSDTQALNNQLDSGFPSLKHLTLDTSHISTRAWTEFKSRWKIRSWTLSPMPGMMPIRLYPMKDFYATVRNPLSSL